MIATGDSRRGPARTHLDSSARSESSRSRDELMGVGGGLLRTSLALRCKRADPRSGWTSRLSGGATDGASGIGFEVAEVVEALEPRIMVQLITGREELDSVAQEAAERLEAALAELKDDAGNCSADSTVASIATPSPTSSCGCAVRRGRSGESSR